MKTILVIGGSIFQTPLMHSAHKKGWKVICIDGNPNVHGATIADHFENVDLKDLDGALAVGKKYNVNGVITAGTDFSTTVAYVAESMGLPTVPYEVAMKCTNKFLMREALAEAGIPIPRYMIVKKPEDNITIEARCIGFPLVIKPVDNMGARGIRRIDDMETLLNIYKDVVKYSRTNEIIIEEFMPGPEYSCDSIFIDGDLKFISIADRHIYFSPYFIELGHSVPANLTEKQLENFKEIFIEAVRALGIKTGQAKGDVKITPDGIKIGEIAARMSGSFNSGWTVPLATGINIHEAAVVMSIGEDPGDLSYDWETQSGAAERTIISLPGKIKQIQQGGKVTGEKVLYFWKKEGDEVEFPINNMGKCGCVVVKSSLNKIARGFADLARKNILLRLEPNNQKTERFLNDEDDLNFISAFREEPIDYYNFGAMNALGRISEITRININKLLKIENFWKSFIKGGVQGGVYRVDSYLENKKKATK